MHTGLPAFKHGATAGYSCCEDEKTRNFDGKTFGKRLLGKERAWGITFRCILRRRDELK
jgi:hypothetical protein